MRKHRLIAVSALSLIVVSVAIAATAGTRRPAGASPLLTPTHPSLQLVSATKRPSSPYLELTADEVRSMKPLSGPPLELVTLLGALAAQHNGEIAYLNAVAQLEAFYEGVWAAWNASSHPVYHSSGGSSGGGGGAGGNFARIRACESGGNYATNTGNGYYGAYQFSASTWHSLGYSGLPSDAPPSVQDQAAQQLAARSGFGQWPVCGR